jgi:hypothetical protein
MRKLLGLAFVVSLIACNGDGIPLDSSGVGGDAGNHGGGGSGGGAGGSGGGSMSIPDMAGPSQSGRSGGACKITCDCESGLACFRGKCRKLQIPVYCCEATDCPSGQICQSQLGGPPQQCGNMSGGGGPGGDGGGGSDGGGGGGGSYCQYIRCQSDDLCSQAGCGACSNGVCGM